MRPSSSANSAIYEKTTLAEREVSAYRAPIDCQGSIYCRFCRALDGKDAFLVELIMREASHSASRHIRRKMLKTLLARAVHQPGDHQ